MSVKSRVVANLSVRREQPGHYSYAVAFGDQVLFEDEGFSSIAEALRTAAAESDDIVGYEVAYGGYVCGTYRREDLLTASERIADEGVSTAAQFL